VRQKGSQSIDHEHSSENKRATLTCRAVSPDGQTFRPIAKIDIINNL
jgi:hypothetical protein